MNKIISLFVYIVNTTLPKIPLAQDEIYENSNIYSTVSKPPKPPQNEISIRSNLSYLDIGKLVSGFNGIEGKVAKEVATNIPVLELGLGYSRIIGHLDSSELRLGGFFEFSHPTLMGGINDDGKVEPIKGISLPYEVQAQLELYTLGIHLDWNIPIHLHNVTIGPVFSLDPYLSKLQSAVLYGVEPKNTWLKSTLNKLNIKQNGTVQANGYNLGLRFGGGLEIGYLPFTFQLITQTQLSINSGTLYQNKQKITEYEYTDSQPIYSANLNLKF